MTYPQYPAQPAYPAQPPQYPGYPPQPPQGYPAYPPQQGAYPAPAPAQQPLARGTIDDFFGQPAASGKSISFNGKPPGTTYAGIVARTLTHADIQQQTDISRRPLTHPDGRPKFVMIVPLQLQPSAEFPDGRAAWYVKGADKTELERAMEAAGLPPGTAPEAGAMITITYTGDRPIPNLNAQKVKTVTYTRPAGAATSHQPAISYVPDPNGQAAQDMVTGNGNLPPWDQAPQPAPIAPQPASVPQAPPYVPAAVQAQPAAAPQQAPMTAPPGLSPEQLAYLAQLTGQQQ